MGASTSIADDRDARHSRSRSLTVRWLVGLISRLPQPAIEPVARVLAWLYRTAAPRKLRRARANLELAFAEEKDAAQLDELARASLDHQALSLLETVREMRRPGAVTIEGVEELERQVENAERHGGGQILVTAHLGSWELLNRAATQAAAHGFFALAKQPDVGAASSLLDEVRRAAGTRVLTSGAKSTLKHMLAVLKSGGWIGLAMDQRPDGPGIPVRFFGRETSFVAGPARLIESQDCGVLAAFCVRIGRGRYRLIAHSVEFDADDSREAITQRLASELETAIRAYPEQWLWTYRRWPGASPPARRVTGDE